VDTAERRTAPTAAAPVGGRVWPPVERVAVAAGPPVPAPGSHTSPALIALTSPSQVPKPGLVPLSCGLGCAFVFIEKPTQDGSAPDPSVGKVRGAVIWPGWEEPQSSRAFPLLVDRFSAPTRRLAAARDRLRRSAASLPLPPARSRSAPATRSPTNHGGVRSCEREGHPAMRVTGRTRAPLGPAPLPEIKERAERWRCRHGAPNGSQTDGRYYKPGMLACSTNHRRGQDSSDVFGVSG
jgi:hypothetical protein